MDYKTDKSAFNMGLATLERINILLKEIELAAYQNDYQSWARKLINLYKELRPFTRKNLQMRNKIDAKMLYAKKIDRAMDFKSVTINTQESEKELDSIEMELRDLIMEYDLLMPRKDDPRFAVLDR